MRPNMIARIAAKEFGLFFSSPIGYLFLLAYLGVTLFAFFWGEAFFARNVSDVRPMFEWLPILLVFLSAALTMRMWSDERRTGTLELIATVPVTSFEFVTGKFLACWLLLIIALALTLPLPITVSYIANLDWGPVFAGYVAAAVLGAAYLSIGLFASAKSDNQIVALIVATFGCGAFYLIGSDFITGFVGGALADAFRFLGAGSRFEAITRGVLDLRDLYFYASVVGIFFVLNVYAVESHGWTQAGNRSRHVQRLTVLGLVVANLVVANIWLASVSALRWDVTEGNQYSISDATKNTLRRLEEPLLLRGYFSEKTHPLLAPLVPQLKDLLTEYEVVGGNVLRLEIVDPASDPELEDEANTKYGIRPVPFQVADRHQSSLVNSYFDVLVQYGDEYHVLGFRDLIEVKVQSESSLDVQLRNPEYDITRAIKKVLYDFRGGGGIFETITGDVRFVGYISDDSVLPEALRAFRTELATVLDELEAESGGKFTSETINPQAGDGSVATAINEQFGFAPMAASLFDANTFYFYLTLTDNETMVQVPIPESLDAEGLKRDIEEGLKRFATGVLKTVALTLPPEPPPFLAQRMPQQGNRYTMLREVLTNDYNVTSADLGSGAVSTATEVLFVIEPKDLDEKSLFAIDQFLMRGGTVVIAAGAYNVTTSARSLTVEPHNTGLADWLDHHGVSMERAFVMDPLNAAFPLPVIRQLGGLRFQDVQMVDYPYFVDVREDGLNQDLVITSDLPQLTMTWGSPIEIDEDKLGTRTATTLIESSPESWRSSSTNITPELSADGRIVFTPEGDLGPSKLGVLLEGRFDSFFEESPLLAEPADGSASGDDEPSDEEDSSDDETSTDEDASDADEEEADTLGTVSSVIKRSPESARLIVFGSNSFVTDQNLRTLGAAEGTVYVNSAQLFANVVDWAVEDEALLSIRSRGHFNRTLPPMDEDTQRTWEFANYGMVLAGLVVVFLINRRRTLARRSRYQQMLQEAS